MSSAKFAAVEMGACENVCMRKTGLGSRPRKPKPPLYVGRWLRALGLSQIEVGAKAGISKAMMSQIVSEERYPGPGNIDALEAAMGLPEGSLRRPPPDAGILDAISSIDPAIIARLTRKP